MEPIIIPLRTPLTHGTETITELRFTREPQARDMRGIKIRDMTFDDVLLLVSRLVGLPPSVLGQMHMQDFAGVGEVVAGFLGDGR